MRRRPLDEQNDGATARAWVRRVAVATCLAIAGVVAGPLALAQVPGLPSVPGVPDAPSIPPDVEIPARDAIEQAEDTIVPVLIDLAIAAQPAVSSAGFALRAPCSAAGTAVVLLALSGGALPYSTGFVITPLLILCGAAYEPGPADPVFGQVDDAVGDQIEDAGQPVLDQAGAALEPSRPSLAQVCVVLALAGGTFRQVPPPLDRFDVTNAVCSG